MILISDPIFLKWFVFPLSFSAYLFLYFILANQLQLYLLPFKLLLALSLQQWSPNPYQKYHVLPSLFLLLELISPLTVTLSPHKGENTVQDLGQEFSRTWN